MTLWHPVVHFDPKTHNFWLFPLQSILGAFFHLTEHTHLACVVFGTLPAVDIWLDRKKEVSLSLWGLGVTSFHLPAFDFIVQPDKHPVGTSAGPWFIPLFFHLLILVSVWEPNLDLLYEADESHGVISSRNLHPETSLITGTLVQIWIHWTHTHTESAREGQALYFFLFFLRTWHLYLSLSFLHLHAESFIAHVLKSLISDSV